jgi:hypothetical protein
MRIRATEVSDEQQAEFDGQMRDLRERLLDRVEPILAPLGDEDLQAEVYELAFAPNDTLPKRTRRPHMLAAHLAEQIYLAHAPSDDRREALLDATVLMQEYCDIIDDIVDGDVATGREEHTLAVSQFLLPLLVGRLNDLGHDAVAYWSRRLPELNRALLLEARKSPSAETYIEILGAQSRLFLIPTGLAAVAADCDEATVERSERIGSLVYRYAQVALDIDQHGPDTDEAWNASALFGREGALDRLEDYADRLDTLLDPLPDEHARLIATALAADTDVWEH